MSKHVKQSAAAIFFILCLHLPVMLPCSVAGTRGRHPLFFWKGMHSLMFRVLWCGFSAKRTPSSSFRRLLISVFQDYTSDVTSEFCESFYAT